MAEPLNATFFAFRKREKGGVLLGASVAYALSLVLLVVASLGLVWLALGGVDLFSWYREVVDAEVSGSPPAPPELPNPAAILLIIPLYFLFLVALFVLAAAYESACVRWMLRGERSALGLHFGADMWRVYGTYWVFLLIAVLTAVGFLIVSMIAGVIGASAGDLGGWIAGGIVLAAMLFCLYLAVRLSSASATSIALGRFDPLAAWSASRDRFWAIFGAYLLLGLIYVIVSFSLSAVLFGAYYMQIFASLDWTLAQSDPQAFMRAYTQARMLATQQMLQSPGTLALYAGGQLLIYAVMLVFYVLWFGVEARVAQAALEEGKIQAAS